MMNKKSLFLKVKHSIFSSWLVSYMLILLIPVIFSGVVYFVALQTVEKEINKANMEMLNQVQINTDNILYDAQRLSSDIAFNANVQRLMTFNEYPKIDGHYTVTELFKEFKRYDATNGYIDNFYVFFKNADFVVSPLTSAKSRAMYDILGYGGGITFDQWYRLLTEKHVRDYVPLHLKSRDNEQAKAITYINSLPISDPDHPLATVVVVFNESRFREMFQSIQGVDQGDFFILDENNTLLLSGRPSAVPEFIKEEGFTGKSGIFERQFNDEAVTVSFVGSKVSGLKYVAVVPKKVFMGKSVFLRNIIILEILLCLLIGGVVSIILTRIHYNPVSELVKLLSFNKTQKSSSDDFNEYHFIQEAIRSTLGEKEIINKRFEQQTSIFRSNFLHKLLKGKLGNTLSIQDSLHSLNIHFKSEAFAVMLIHVEDCGKLSKARGYGCKEEDLKTVQFIISNVMEELMGERHSVFTTELDDMLAYLINFDGNDCMDKKQELFEIAGKAQNFICEHFSIQFTISISNLQETVDRIPQAYEEALEAMEYKMLMGSGKIISHSDIRSFEQRYFYPLEIEQQLINYIKSGDFIKVEGILDRIFKHNFLDAFTSIQMAKCLTFDLVCTIIKAMDECGDLFLEQENPIEILLECKTVMEMKEVMLHILSKVCENVKMKKSNKTQQLGHLAAEFIKSNYHSLDLNISMVAEQFDMTPTYISKVFKEQTGEGMHDYINKIRLQRAKELLKYGKASISETAVKVGYSNSNALIRAFKKYEGTTPGQYREDMEI